MHQSASRLDDIGSEHNGFPPTTISSGSADTFVNGKPAARQGDTLLAHKKPKHPTHPRHIAMGSPTVFINGRAAARTGDAISCGGNIATGSSNVFIGNKPRLGS